MNNKTLNILVMVIILAAVVINNLGELYTFKMIFNGVAMAILILIGFVRISKYKKKFK